MDIVDLSKVELPKINLMETKLSDVDLLEEALERLWDGNLRTNQFFNYRKVYETYLCHAITHKSRIAYAAKMGSELEEWNVWKDYKESDDERRLQRLITETLVASARCTTLASWAYATHSVKMENERVQAIQAMRRRWALEMIEQIKAHHA